jgi:CIC family chloride channel protein
MRLPFRKPPQKPTDDEPPSSTTASLRGLFSFVTVEGTPLDLQIIGRALLHAALVGVGAGLVGAAFFAGLEWMQRLLLEGLAGYVPLRASGEQFLPESTPSAFRGWLLLLLPAVGALIAGLLSLLAPETRGGGGDAMIEAFHHNGGVIRRRVIWLKGLASIFTLGTGGSGGREGPTMQIGGAIGSFVARTLKVSTVERRVLMVAGVAAGMSAVFRTPLGAALLAIEVLYRDDFEAEALIPAILASVVAYAVVISIYGETTMFAHAPHYPFVPAHLPLYLLLAILVAILAALFVGTLRGVQRVSAKLPIPAWSRPAIGGALVGAIALPLILLMATRVGAEGRGLGILGGGYGIAQVAILGANWLPGGWLGVELLLLLAAAKLLSASLTIGSGGSAGDFAPSLVLGGIFGGAFGRAAQLLLHDPSIDPGAFALVGMGTFYGGVAHVPISSLILVSELAGSYDLLVPLMLASGVAFVALRNKSLYGSQPHSRKESPVHRAPAPLDVLTSVRVGDVLIRDRPFLRFAPNAPIKEIVQRLSDTTWQDTFPVVDAGDRLQGLITADTIRYVSAEQSSVEAWTIAADVMQPAITLKESDHLRAAAQRMLANTLREIPVVDDAGKILGFLDEADISKAYLESTAARADGSNRMPTIR